MKEAPLPLPPRLSMDDYCRFVAENCGNGKDAIMRRQKEIEEHIEKPFSMLSESMLSEESGLLGS